MRQLNFPDCQQTFNEYFASAKHTMFKCEVLADYSAIDMGPSLRAWLDGEPERARRLYASDPGTINSLRKRRESPAEITRVHIVGEPRSRYLQWEEDVAYRSLVNHGVERVLLAPANELLGLWLPEGDYWMFDDSRVVQWDYSHTGEVTGGKVWDEGHNIDHFRRLSGILLAVGTPLEFK